MFLDWEGDRLTCSFTNKHTQEQTRSCFICIYLLALSANKQAMAAAIRDMPQPPGLRRTQVPEKWGNRSALFDTGVRYEQDCANPDPQKQRWFCMAAAACRRESMKAKPAGGISCTASATGNATRHLSVFHGGCSRSCCAFYCGCCCWCC